MSGIAELVHSPDRLLHPLKRTRPKGEADPGWQQIGWDEALDMTASAMRRIGRGQILRADLRHRPYPALRAGKILDCKSDVRFDARA